ncbi:MAG: hypothetical protein ABI239_12240 [Aquihabitans sp.]
MKHKKILASMVATAALLLAGGTAANAQYIDGGTVTTTTKPGTVTTQPGDEIPIVTVVRGERVDVTGTGCGASATVTITYDDGRTLGTTTAASDGTFATSVVIPVDSTLGEHLLTASCAGTPDQFLRVNVIAAAGTGQPGTGGNAPLVRTGSDTAPLVGIGAAALVLGGAFVYGARRPRTA